MICQVLRFLQSHCGVLLRYSACSMFVAVSDSERNIIVGFEGTQNMRQLADQLFVAFLAGMQESDIGGEVRIKWSKWGMRVRRNHLLLHPICSYITVATIPSAHIFLTIPWCRTSPTVIWLIMPIQFHDLSIIKCFCIVKWMHCAECTSSDSWMYNN